MSHRGCRLTWRAFLVLGWITAQPALGSVRLPDVLSDHMVLQENAEVGLWGWASVGNVVDVQTSWGARAETTADHDGAWKVRIRTPRAHALAEGLHPETLTITMPQENTIQITDVLIGEVWLCSGQSNMEMMLRPGYPPGWNSWYGEEYWAGQESLKSDRPYLRVYDVEKTAAPSPQADVKGFLPSKGIQPEDAHGLIRGRKRGWQACTPVTAPDFSAVAYYFGSALAEKLQVPVGLITSDVGGTKIQLWMKGGEFYNGMIAPFFPMTLKGVIWYQGESNVGDAPGSYAGRFKEMIHQWREGFHDDTLPFYFVQIAPFGKSPAAGNLREDQAAALELKNTGMAVVSDVGDPTCIHPKDKRDVGQRLALQALRKTYGRTEVIADGPAFETLHRQGGKIDVQFRNEDGGLVSRDGKSLTCFSVAGADGRFIPESADIKGADVVVSCAGVTDPRELRFAWGSADQPNLMSKDGLPVSQFQAPIH